MLGSAVILAGSALVASAAPASAAAGGTNICSSFVGTTNLVTGAFTGTDSGCHEHGSGTVAGTVDSEYLTAPARDTIHWATGHATSVVIRTEVISGVGAPCPAGDVVTHVTLRVVHGPYTGSTGHNIICNDISHFPIVHLTNVGPIVI
jgi:hypothetical protein